MDFDAIPPDSGAVQSEVASTDVASDAIDAVSTSCPPQIPAGTCNALDPVGPVVPSTCSSATAPQPSGGTVEDGTYVLDGSVYYGGCPTSPDADRNVWVVCGDVWLSVQESKGVVNGGNQTRQVHRYAATKTKTTTSLHLAVKCADAMTSTQMVDYTYDASPGHFTLYLPPLAGTNTGTLAHHYSRR